MKTLSTHPIKGNFHVLKIPVIINTPYIFIFRYTYLAYSKQHRTGLFTTVSLGCLAIDVCSLAS